MQVSSIQLNKTSSAHHIVHPSPKANSLSISIYPSICPPPATSIPLSLYCHIVGCVYAVCFYMCIKHVLYINVYMYICICVCVNTHIYKMLCDEGISGYLRALSGDLWGWRDFHSNTKALCAFCHSHSLIVWCFSETTWQMIF